VIIAEVYKGAQTTMARLCEKHAPATGMKLLTPQEHRELFKNVGFADVKTIEEPAKGWICAIGAK
jgi:hypothetical protein